MFERNRLKLILGFLPVLLLVSACLGPENRREYEDLLAELDRQPAARLSFRRDENSRKDTLTLPDLKDEFTLAMALRVALSTNPKLAAMLRAWEAKTERVPQAAALKDPQLRWMYNIEPIQTRAGPKRNEFLLTQMFPFPGKLGLREEVALAAARSAKEDYESIQRLLIKAVAKNFYELSFIYEAIKVNDRNKALIKSLEEIAQSKYRVGAVTQQDVIRAQIRRTHLLHRAIILKRDKSIAEARLNEALGRRARAPIGLPSSDKLPQSLEALGLLEARAIKQRPELRSIEQHIRGEFTKVKLAEKEILPDFTLGLFYGDIEGGTNRRFRSDGDDAVKFIFGLNLPIYAERRHAKIREAKARTKKALAEHRVLQNRIEREVREAHDRVNEAQQETALFQGTLLNQAKQNLAAARVGYETNRVNFLTLIDAQKAIEDIELGEKRAMKAWQIALEELRWATGSNSISK